MPLVLNVPFVRAVSYPLHIFITVASMCLFSKHNIPLSKIYKLQHKFWGTKHINQITCPPTMASNSLLGPAPLFGLQLDSHPLPSFWLNQPAHIFTSIHSYFEFWKLNILVSTGNLCMSFCHFNKTDCSIHDNNSFISIITQWNQCSWLCQLFNFLQKYETAQLIMINIY